MHDLYELFTEIADFNGLVTSGYGLVHLDRSGNKSSVLSYFTNLTINWAGFCVR